MKTQQQTPAVTVMQIKDLKNRLNAVAHRFKNRVSDAASPQEPANVKAARKLVKAFEAKARRARDAAYAKASARVRLIEREILFGDKLKALDMIDALEKETKK